MPTEKKDHCTRRDAFWLGCIVLLVLSQDWISEKVSCIVTPWFN